MDKILHCPKPIDCFFNYVYVYCLWFLISLFNNNFVSLFQTIVMCDGNVSIFSVNIMTSAPLMETLIYN